MKSKTLGFIVLIDLALLIMWLVLMIILNVTSPIETFEQAMEFATQRHWLFYTLNYTNAIIFTLLNVAVYAGLYALLRRDYPEWSSIGFAFVPMYGIIALLSYLSQLVVIPRLIDLYAIPEYTEIATVLLKHTIQIWPESSLQSIDQFSYLLLGIPSIIYGCELYAHSKSMRVAGGLLALSGVATPFIGIGIIVQLSQLVTISSMIGGVLSIVSFVPLGMNLLRGEIDKPKLRTIEVA